MVQDRLPVFFLSDQSLNDSRGVNQNELDYHLAIIQGVDMGLSANDKLPAEISIVDAYSKLRAWYQSNIGKIPSNLEESYADGSRKLIRALPDAEGMLELEMRGVFQEVFRGLLEWGFHESDGHYKMAAYVKGALQKAGLDYNLSALEMNMLCNSPAMSVRWGDLLR